MSLSGTITDSHTLQSMFFCYISRSYRCLTVPITLSVSVSASLACSPHDEWIKTKKRRQTTKRSVLADSSDLGIYGEDLGSDIDPGCFMCTALSPLKGTSEPFHGNCIPNKVFQKQNK